ncbi:cytochrome P450 [Streptomyces litchfieldiae]|uniref:Cytochrome P450 n=1 Tax=Streptomyces litchfieldiae TaxID=3075543 RepID=A0ABU2MVF5_9ACTN|nr:cytochrome P450 [Streptomyces sp. DSM 44938]MDT0345372.1 cytochrome P450 [Streptomyces sp. DSM 44938]
MPTPSEERAVVGGGTTWLVTRYADVREVLGDSERFSTRPGPGAEMPERLAALRPVVQDIIDERLDALAAAGPPADLCAGFAVPVTTSVIARLLGVPRGDRELFRAVAAAAFGSAGRAAPETGSRPLFDYVRRLLRERRAAPGEDVLSQLITSGVRSEQPLTEDEMVMMGGGLLISGLNTTATTLAQGMLALLEDPGELDRLRADPARVPEAVGALVRFFGGAAALTREVTRDTELGGKRVAAGDLVVVALQPADRGHDRGPAPFPGPDRPGLTRRPVGHFGLGPRHCVGQQTARLELDLALRTLLRRVPSLRLAVPLADIEFRADAPMVGPAALPVTWDEIGPAAGRR